MSVFRNINSIINNKTDTKVITYKKLEDIQEEYSSYITAPIVVPAIVKGIYLDWYPMSERMELNIPVSYKQHVLQGKPKKKTLDNIFGACPTITKIGSIVTLLLRLISSFECSFTSTPIHRLKKMACRIVFAPVGTDLQLIAIGHPEKDYFLYLEDFYNSQPGDIIPGAVAHIKENQYNPPFLVRDTNSPGSVSRLLIN